MFRLNELLKFHDIVIQCHNIPDADSIASAFAVFTYLKENGKESKIIYSGHAKITKANLIEMIETLSIPIEYVKEMPPLRTLITIDCQYGERNVNPFTADNIIIIDHHVDTKHGCYAGIIHSGLGSCSTLVWDLLNKEQFDFKIHPGVSTALYYGLYTDTNSLEEIAHPLDRDARDSLKFNPNIIKRLRNNNLSLPELTVAGTALTQHYVNYRLKYAIFKAEPCDPNILGFISDLALQVSGIDVCMVYNELPDGYKLSTRSCAAEVMANEFTQYVTEGVGSGGGHITKAGGFIDKSKINVHTTDIESFMEKRAQEYFNSYDIIYASEHNIDVSDMSKYKKLRIPVAYVLSTDIFEKGTPMLIRTLEGDAETESSEEIYLMIGVLGEVYPITSEKFKRSYETLESDHIAVTDFEYSPTVKNKITGDSIEIIGLAKACAAVGDVSIYAAPLSKNTKVFTAWNTDSYMSGKPGDYIALRCDDYNDVYIIREDIFYKTYEKIPLSN